MSTLATDHLADLVRKKHQILAQLCQVGKKQQQLVDGGSSQQLMQLLAAKQHLINGLQLVERHLRPFQAEDPDARVWRSPEVRQQCAQQADECRDLLAQVIQLEKQHETQMARRRDEVATQLQRSGAAQQATGAYRQHRIESPSRGVPLPAASIPDGAIAIDLSSEAR